METTKKLNETPLLQEMNKTHSYVVVDDNGNVSRIRDVAKEYVTETELNDFIKPYDERITTNETDISNLETNIGSTKTDVLDLESYMDIVTPKNTASGELVHVTDALPLPTFGTKSAGNVEQETTKGQQLFNYKDTAIVTNGVTVDENGWITATYDNSNGSQVKYLNYWCNKSNLKINTSYKIVLEVKKVTGSGYIVLTNESEASQFNKSSSYIFAELSDNSITIADNITKNSFEKSLYDLRSYVGFDPGQNGSITFRLSVLEDTTVTPETFVYEKYTGNQASPNPEYPQEIEVLEGYNLFDKNNANILYDTYIGSAGNVGSSPTNNILYLEIKPNTSYTIQKISSSRFRVGTYNSLDVVGKTLNNIITNLNDSITSYTLKNTTDKYLFFQYLGGDKNEQEILDSIMISEGTDIKPYLPYGCVGYKVNGKNLFDENGFYKSNFNNVIKVENGYTFDVIKTKSIYTIEKAKPNTAYIFKGRISSSIGADLYIHFNYTDGTKKMGAEIRKSGAFDTTFNLTTAETKTLQSIEFSMYGYGNYKTYTFQDFMLSEEDDTYEPYQEQIVYLDLKGNWVGAINDNIKDYLVTDKKKYWLVKNVGKVVFTGEENITLERINDYGIANFFVSCKDMTINFICDNFVKQDSLIADTKTEGMLYTDNGPYIRIKSDFISTVDEFKQWLKENKITIYYKLLEPQIIELGELPEPIKTFEGVNNIQLLDNLDTEIEVVYAQDVKKYINSKLAEISAQII